MKSSSEKYNPLMTTPGLVLPLGSKDTVSLWNTKDLRPLPKERLQRLPLPSKGRLDPLPSSEFKVKMNPYDKIQHLERNIKFLRESHAHLLIALHDEIDKLKSKNRDLMFQLTMNDSRLKVGKIEISDGSSQKIECLEMEVRQLRESLKEAHLTNSCLSSKLEKYKIQPKHSFDTLLNNFPSRLPSPKLEEYTDTLKQIQTASMKSRSQSLNSNFKNKGIKLPKIGQILNNNINGSSIPPENEGKSNKPRYSLDNIPFH